MCIFVRRKNEYKKYFDKDIDYYRSIRENGADIMRSIEQREREATGIKTLKVAYNKVFGYYLEVSIRRMTMIHLILFRKYLQKVWPK